MEISQIAAQCAAPLFIILSAIFNAVMDKTETSISFQASIFRRRSIGFWCKPISAHNIRFIKYTQYRPDAWHLAKSGMVVFILLAMVCYQPIIHPAIDFLLGGVLWNTVFNIFYNRLLKK